MLTDFERMRTKRQLQDKLRAVLSSFLHYPINEDTYRAVTIKLHNELCSHAVNLGERLPVHGKDYRWEVFTDRRQNLGANAIILHQPAQRLFEELGFKGPKEILDVGSSIT